MEKTITIEVTSEGQRVQKVQVVPGVSLTILTGGQVKVYHKGDLARYANHRNLSGIGKVVEIRELKIVLEDYRRFFLDFIRFEELNWDFDNGLVSKLGLQDTPKVLIESAKQDAHG